MADLALPLNQRLVKFSLFPMGVWVIVPSAALCLIRLMVACSDGCVGSEKF